MLLISNKEIRPVCSIKFLGILLGENLTWKDHVRTIENKISKNLGPLYKAKKINAEALKCFFYTHPAGIYLFKVNNRNTRTRCEICSKLTINTPERRHWRRSGVFIVNFEHISHLVLVFLLLTLSR